MKTQKELNALKEEVEELNKKLEITNKKEERQNLDNCPRKEESINNKVLTTDGSFTKISR